MARRLLALAALLVASFLIQGSSVAAGVASPGILCGTISSDRTLSPAAAPYYVLACPTTVPAGVTLTVAPGTAVIALQNGGLTVHGNLDAPGTAEHPIYLISAALLLHADWRAWKGIAVSTDGTGPAPTLILRHVRVTWADVTATGTSLTDIEDSFVGYSPHVGIRIDTPDGGAVTVARNTILTTTRITAQGLVPEQLSDNRGVIELRGSIVGGTLSGGFFERGLLAKGTLVVAAGAQLLYERGSTFSFTPGSGLVVHGWLRPEPISGAGARTTFTSTGPWSGIVLAPDPNRDSLPYLLLDWARVVHAGISATDSLIRINQTTIDGAPGAGIEATVPLHEAPVVSAVVVTGSAGPAIILHTQEPVFGDDIGGNRGTGNHPDTMQLDQAPRGRVETALYNPLRLTWPGHP